MTRSIMIAGMVAALAIPLAAQSGDPLEYWMASNPRSDQIVDHSAWDAFLRSYVVTNTTDGVNRVAYGRVTPADKTSLDRYIGRLEAVAVTGLSRAEQRAFWVNLYNAVTVQVILDHYPVGSIRDIRLGGLFSTGPWKARLVTVEGNELSLDDIEHRILRPIWSDARTHYAVNCASYGCPNLQPVAFTAQNMETLLERGARDYINHPRGVTVDGNRITVSSIYTWFTEDFGGSQAGVISHLEKYAGQALRQQLAGFSGRLRFDYDWSLNEAP